MSTPSIGRAPARVKPEPAPKISYPFHAIPKELLRAGDLSFGAVCLLSVLLNETGQGRRPYRGSNAELAEEIGRNRSDVIRYLDELEKAGLIARDLADGGRTRHAIRVVWSPAEVTEPSVRLVTGDPVRGDRKFGQVVTASSVRSVTEGSVTSLKKGEEKREEAAWVPPARQTGVPPAPENPSPAFARFFGRLLPPGVPSPGADGPAPPPRVGPGGVQ